MGARTPIFSATATSSEFGHLGIQFWLVFENELKKSKRKSRNEKNDKNAGNDTTQEKPPTPSEQNGKHRHGRRGNQGRERVFEREENKAVVNLAFLLLDPGTHH